MTTIAREMVEERVRRMLVHEFVRKEVERLGLVVDESQPPRIVVPGDGGDWIYEHSLDDTNFFRLEESSI